MKNEVKNIQTAGYNGALTVYALLEPLRLFDFGKFSYLPIIRTPCFLETSEYDE